MTINKNLYLYILMRTDLGSLGPGRAAAQASHAASAFAKKYGLTKDYKDWSSQTPQGFGTAIVLGADFNTIGQLHKKAYHQNFATEQIIDPDYVISFSPELMPYIKIGQPNDSTYVEKSVTDPNKYLLHREEMTCAYIFGDKEKLVELLGELPLYS